MWGVIRIGIYGIDFFGTDFYGPNPQFLPSTYSVAPFSAEAMGYTTFLLSWNKPTLLYPPVPQGTPQQATPGLKDSPNARVRLLRNTLNLPSDENDGVQLFDLPLAYSPVRWQDSPVISGAFSYYTVFVFDGTLWQRAGDLIALAPNNFQYSQRLWELTPQVYHNWDYNFSDPTSTNPIVNQGPLQRFYGLMGLQFDLIRTELETLLDANDPTKCSGGLLPLLSNQLGLDYEPQMGMYLNRRLISNAIYHYKVKGSEPGVEGVVADASGWSSNITTGYNLILDQNNAAFTQGTGLWAGPVAAPSAVNLQTVSIPVGGGPSNPAILGGLSTAMQATNIAGLGPPLPAYSLVSTAGSPILTGIPLKEGNITTPWIVISGYIWPQNTHNFAWRARFYDQSGNLVSTSTPSLQVCSAATWTRVWNLFTVPANAVYLTYDLFSVSDGFSINEKVWFQFFQVEEGAIGQATPQATPQTYPQAWQNARDTRVDIRPDRINYVINPNFESGTSSWTPTLNCGISQSSVPGSLNRFPVLRQKATAFSTGTQQITVAIPAGIANGDLILLHLTVYGNTSLTAPFGWNVAISNKTGSTNEDLQEVVYWKFANNEPATYNWFSSNITPVTSQILSFYNTDTVSPIASASSETGSGTTVAVPSQPVSSSIPAGTQVVFISTNPSTVIFPLGSEAQQTSVSAGTLLSADSSTLNITGPTTIPAANASLANGRLWLGQNIIIKGSTLPSAPASYTGSFSLEAISSGAGAMSVTSSAMPVTPGLFYAGSGYLIAQSISEPIQMFINWLDGTNALISSTSSVIGQENTLGSQWERLGLAQVAPPGAATATLTFKWGLTLGSGEAHYLDAVLFEQAPSVRSYFDGSTPLNGAAFAPPVSADYLWQLDANGVPRTNNGPSFYYKRRTQKNFRLTTLLPKYLPAGGTFTLLYGLPT